jgi:hypothetical protein
MKKVFTKASKRRKRIDRKALLALRGVEEEVELQERSMPLGNDTVEKFRKDFLTLTRNVKRLRNYRDADKLRKALRIWQERLEKFGVQIRQELEGRIRIAGFGDFKGIDKGEGKPKGYVDKSWAEYHLKHMSPLWDFLFEVGQFPIEPWGYIKRHRPPQMVYGGLENGEYVAYKKPRRRFTDAERQENLFKAAKEPIRKWMQRVRRKATPAWKWLKEVGDWAESEDFRGGGGETIKLKTHDAENVRLHGFQLRMVGYEHDNERHRSGLKNIKNGLAMYRKRAAKVYPWLLKAQLPIVVYFEGGRSHGDTAASYERDHIRFEFWGIHVESPRDQTRVHAHEMGHHLWQSVLSGEAQDVWRAFIRQDYTSLDLRDVMKHLKPGEKIRDLEDRIEKTMPILHLQLATLMHGPFKDIGLWSLSSIQDHIDAGKDTVVRVPSSPITGYAAKNPEESFCEALGMLVGFGPRAVLPNVAALLRSLVGNVKLEDVSPLLDSIDTLLTEYAWNKALNDIRLGKLKKVNTKTTLGAHVFQMMTGRGAKVKGKQKREKDTSITLYDLEIA